MPLTIGAQRLTRITGRVAQAVPRGLRRRSTAVVIAALALAGLAVRHSWWTATPLSAGDWHWWDRGRLLQWFPWPTVWDQTLGFGGQNRFEDTFRYPIYALSGLIAALGGSWSASEKLVYFLPFAVLLPIAGWLLAREVIGPSRWTLLSPLILLGSSYLLLESNVHVPLTMAEAVGLLTLTSFIRAMRRRSVPWAVATGLLLSAVMAYDVRPGYLTVLLMGLYFVILALADFDLRGALRRGLLGLLAAAVFLFTEAYWWLPLLSYGSTPHFPTPQSPNFNIITLEHGIAGVSAFWTGRGEANLVEAPLNPLYMILPLVAFVPLIQRRLSPEVLWLALAAVVAAFMAKTSTPPVGWLYDWMYLHVPGWRLFREGSKFLYIVVTAYSILVPLGLQTVMLRAAALSGGWSAAARGAVVLAVAVIVSLCAQPILVLQSGALDSTTRPTPEPSSFAALSKMVDADQRQGTVMWIGEPVLLGGLDRNHRFVVASARHSVAYMTGSITGDQVNHRDLFQYFCGDSFQPYCYLNDDTFPYLARTSGAVYVVAPAGSQVGVLPKGITRPWLRERLTAMLGTPRTLGAGEQSLLVWRIDSPAPAVKVAPAVAVVNSGPWSLAQAFPALQALGLPALYRQSLDAAHYPPAPPGLKDAVEVMPRIDGACNSSTQGTLAILAAADGSSIQATVGGSPMALSLIERPARAPGWGLFGPVQALPGKLTIDSPSAKVGPCLEWSQLAAEAVSGRLPTVGPSEVGAHGERVSAHLEGPQPVWAELTRNYDPGWRTPGAHVHLVGDGLFNLYHAGAAGGTTPAPNRELVFQFETAGWERFGQLISLATVLTCVGFLLWRRRPAQSPARASVETALPMGPSRLGPLIGAACLIVLGAAALAYALEWAGFPSRFTGVALSSDPYRLDVGFETAAIVLLVLGIIARLGEHVAGRRRPLPRPATAWPAREPRIAVLLLLTATVACGTVAPAAPSSASWTALRDAQEAGSTSPYIAANSLDAARTERAAKNPSRCIADYTQALTAFSDFVPAYTGRSDCYLSRGRNAAAASRDYSRAIELNPFESGLYLQRALAEVAAGDPQSAAADDRRAVALPAASPAQFLLAVDGLASLERFGDARAALNEGRARYPASAIISIAAAHLDIALDGDGAALAEFERAKALSSNDQERALLYANLCHYRVLRHDYGQALADCEMSVKYTTAGAGAYDDMSVVHLARGDVAAAVHDLDQAIGAFSGNVGPDAQPSGVDGFGIALLLEARGRAKLEAHDRPSATADFRGALDALPPGTPDFAARLRAEIESAATK